MSAPSRVILPVTRAGGKVVHAVEGPEQGGLAAAGGADNGGDGVLTEVHGGVLYGMGGAEVNVEFVEFQLGIHVNLKLQG